MKFCDFQYSLCIAAIFKQPSVRMKHQQHKCGKFCRLNVYYIGWRRGVVVSGVRRMNEVNARRIRLVLGWVTVFGRLYHPGMYQAN